jgi:hypothetical protein
LALGDRQNILEQENFESGGTIEDSAYHASVSSTYVGEIVVNTPAPAGKKLTGRWYRVKENDDRLKLFYGKNLIWQDTLCIPKRPQPFFV